MKSLKCFFAILVLAVATTTASAQDDWQSRKNRENAATSASSISKNGGRWDANAEAQRKAATRQQTFAFTHCDTGFCYDNLGGVWHRNGPDVLNGPNGRFCQRTGNAWNCN